MLVFGAAHLRQILSAYAAYYNEVRTHLALGKDAPLVRAVQRSGAFLCSQSTEPTAPEEALVCFVLLNVGRLSLFRCVVMMFGLLHRSVLRYLGIAPPAFLAAIGWRNWRHMTGNHQNPRSRVREKNTLRKTTRAIRKRLPSIGVSYK